MNATAFILFKSVGGGGVYWRAVSIGGQRLIIHSELGTTPRVPLQTVRK